MLITIIYNFDHVGVVGRASVYTPLKIFFKRQFDMLHQLCNLICLGDLVDYVTFPNDTIRLSESNGSQPLWAITTRKKALRWRPDPLHATPAPA